MQTTLSPHNQQPYVTRQYPNKDQIDDILNKSAAGQKEWAKVPLKERIATGRKFIVRFYQILKKYRTDLCDLGVL
jgi:acyl-CoA reductase-like NAD-dependent aldehyde dehydrogenase